MEQKKNLQNRSVAYYAIAQLIERGERAKALALHKLMAYTVENKAFLLQLEGDILWSFEDEEAFMKYTQAARLYREESKIINALTLYEHLHSLKTNNLEYLTAIIELYALLDWKERLEDRFNTLISYLDNKKIEEDQVVKVAQSVARQFASMKRTVSLNHFKNYLSTSKHPTAHRAAERIESI